MVSGVLSQSSNEFSAGSDLNFPCYLSYNTARQMFIALNEPATAYKFIHVNLYKYVMKIA